MCQTSQINLNTQSVLLNQDFIKTLKKFCFKLMTQVFFKGMYEFFKFNLN